MMQSNQELYRWHQIWWTDIATVWSMVSNVADKSNNIRIFTIWNTQELDLTIFFFIGNNVICCNALGQLIVVKHFHHSYECIIEMIWNKWNINLLDILNFTGVYNKNVYSNGIISFPRLYTFFCIHFIC